MTMPSTGALNMGGTSSPVSVAQELGLGLTTTISMNQANVRTLAGVGGSGTTWSMNSLYGKSNITVSLAGLAGVYGDTPSPGTAFADLIFYPDGTIEASTNTGTVSAGSWATPTNAGNGANYWIRFTETSSYSTTTVTGSTRGVWLQLSTSRLYGVSRGIIGAGGRYYTVEIASDSAGATIVATATSIGLEAEVY